MENIHLPEPIYNHLGRNFIPLNMMVGIGAKDRFIGLSSDGFDRDFRQIDQCLVDNQIAFVKFEFPERAEDEKGAQVVFLHDGNVGVYYRGKADIEYLGGRLTGQQIHQLNVLLDQYDWAEVTLEEVLNRLEVDFGFPVKLEPVTLQG